MRAKTVRSSSSVHPPVGDWSVLAKWELNTPVCLSLPHPPSPSADFFEEDQLFLILEFEFGGSDLENSDGQVSYVSV